MKKISLVILAAGMGSRYGGLKQIDTVGNNGESIIDFTIYDAIQAGFNKLYLIIRREHEAAFESALIHKVRDLIEVEYVFQELNDLPEGYSVPEGREKPWGTTHALWVCRNQVKEAFMICNADDYYGKDAFKTMAEFLRNDVQDNRYALVAYRLENTLSDSGSVTRGVCRVEDNRLTAVEEIAKIQREGDKVVYEKDGGWHAFEDSRFVSMNFWGFTPHVFNLAERQLIRFLDEKVEDNPMKAEHVIPTMVGETLDEGLYEMRLLSSENSWFGVTYQEDKPYVVEQFRKFKEDGVYPFDLWR